MAATSTHKKVMLISTGTRLEECLMEFSDEIMIEKFTSGGEAIRKLSDLDPSLIVSEFQAGDMDGREVFLAMIGDNRYSKKQPLPFILFSSNEEPRSRFSEELFSLGLCGWYLMPRDTAALKDIFYNHLRVQNGFSLTRELQQEVKKSEFRYRDLLENAVDFIFTLDADGCFL
jgi:PAS domain-containing protein